MDKKVKFPILYPEYKPLQDEVERLLGPDRVEIESKMWPSTTTLSADRVESKSKMWLSTTKTVEKQSTPRIDVKPQNNFENSPDKVRNVYCVFCKSNGEPKEIFSTHYVKNKNGEVTCPILFHLKCRHCQATGIMSHTESYCPKLRREYLEKMSDRPPTIGVMLKQTKRNSTGVRQSIKTPKNNFYSKDNDFNT